MVFLLFNIGLELSLERLQSMQKYVFGMGTTQVRQHDCPCCNQSSHLRLLLLDEELSLCSGSAC